MHTKLANCQDFKGNSVEAFTVYGNYYVRSYNTIIFELDGDGNKSFNNKYYSVTTSKIQNMLIDIFGLNGGKHGRD